jgi:hypothetical protein
MVYVLAGNYQQYTFWLRSNNLDPKRFKYIHMWTDLLGLNNARYITTGTFYERKDFRPIIETMLGRGWVEVTLENLGLDR